MDWNTTWPKLIQFFEQLIRPTEFWTEPIIEDHYHTPNRDWIPPVIAEFIKAGTLDDQEAYSPDFAAKEHGHFLRSCFTN